MKLHGQAHKFDMDNINTDYIIPGKRKFKTADMRELSRYIMEDIDPDFYGRIKKGDFFVGKDNFGCGSSREQAVWVIKESGLNAVFAKSFARIFYRNAFNIGLPLIECDTDLIDEGDILKLDLDSSKLINTTKNKEIKIKPIPPTMIKLLEDGGVIAHFNKHGGFKL